MVRFGGRAALTSVGLLEKHDSAGTPNRARLETLECFRQNWLEQIRQNHGHFG